MLLAERARTGARRQGSNLTLFNVGLSVEDNWSGVGTTVRALSFSIKPERKKPVRFDRSLKSE
jgi:hypothetical protein